MRLVIGSTAARENGVNLGREPKDVDTFTNQDDIGEDSFWDDRFLDYWDDDTDRVATIDELTTIKYSHSFWELRNGSWGKHMADLLKLRAAGGEVIEELYTILYAVWETRHGKKVLNLQKEADEFFTDAVKRRFVHDTIHESIAAPDRPVYEECLRDGHSVDMDMKKVWAMPVEHQLKMFREEIYVTALERKVIPANYEGSSGAAYQWALRRTITSLTKGKSARFLVDHFDELKRPDEDYVKHHLDHGDVLEELSINPGTRPELSGAIRQTS